MTREEFLQLKAQIREERQARGDLQAAYDQAVGRITLENLKTLLAAVRDFLGRLRK